MRLFLFIISLFLCSLASHVENQRIKNSIEIRPKKGFQKMFNVLSRYPALMLLLVFVMVSLQLPVGEFFVVFSIIYAICYFMLRNKKIESFLLKMQPYLDISAVIFFVFMFLFQRIFS